MKIKTYKYLELLIVFVVIPFSFILDYSPLIKLTIGLTGFVYVLFILLKVEKLKIVIKRDINWSKFFRTTLLKFFIIMVITTTMVWFTNKDLLFSVPLNKPKLWIFILFVYSFFSVYPQELLYRTFFFKRIYNSFGATRSDENYFGFC